MGNEKGQLDTSVEIVTPENIAFRYQVAGPFRRLLAYVIDVMVRGIVFFAVSITVTIIFGIVGLAGFGTALALIFWFVLSWFYGGLFETLWNGQTPGKRLLQIRVLAVDGQPINGLQAVLRNILRTVDMQPGVLSTVGLLTAMMNNRFQRLGDIACGTMVVIEERHWFRGVIRITEPEVIRLAGQIPASFQATRSQARALSAYVHRRVYFPWMRRMEIARYMAEPLRQRLDLPPGTNLDHLLCALYHRTFVTDRGEETPPAAESPFMPAQAPPLPVPGPEPVRAEDVVIETGGNR
jgi:uncharacterized RDD family membrane protein YckC